MQTIGQVFRNRAECFGNKPAFVMPDGRFTSFARLNERVIRLNNALQARGVRVGERVGILSRNRTEYIEAYGVSMSGLIALPLNWRLSTRELKLVLDDAQPAALIADVTMLPTIDQMRHELKYTREFICFDDTSSGWESYEGLIEGASSNCSDTEVTPDSTACLMYTSGTTGTPKGAELTHRGLLLNCEVAIREMLGLTEADVTLAPMPFFHVGGMWYHLFPSFAAGCTTVVTPQFDPQVILDLMARHSVTNVHLVPTMIHTLLEQPNVGDFDLSRLRLMFYAASSMPKETLKRALKAFRCDFAQGYGSTEAGMVTCLSPRDHSSAREENDDLLSSCGRPLGNVEIKLIPTEEDDSNVGEIAVRSSMTMSRYWRNPEASRQIEEDGWLRPGDMGRIDANGYLYILDRKSDMIVTGGENVYPREVEDVLLRDPDIAEVAVFDLPDPRWVQKVVAAVVLQRDVGPEVVLQRARQQLAGYKCPKEIFVTDHLPKNAAGKVLRKVLRETYGVGLDA